VPVQGVVREDLQGEQRLLPIAGDELVGHQVDAVVQLSAVGGELLLRLAEVLLQCRNSDGVAAVDLARVLSDSRSATGLAAGMWDRTTSRRAWMIRRQYDTWVSS
jgi:hypothetical protein